jgi:iron complex transport system ATP-binding protein
MLHEGRIFAEGTPEEILTNTHIKEVFGTDVTIIQSPYSGSPQIVLKPGGAKQKWAGGITARRNPTN